MAANTSSKHCRTTAKASGAVVPMLPNEVVAEILVLLPVKSVLRFKSVCKNWLAMLSNPSFIRDHLDCSKKNPSVVMVPTPNRRDRSSGNQSMMFYRYHPADGEKLADLLSTHVVPDWVVNIYLLAHCDGLLAIGTPLNIYVCNPATHELVRLPSTLTRHTRNLLGLQVFTSLGGIWISLCIGRDARSGLYKVFRTFDSQRNGRYFVDVEVLTLGADQLRWQKLPSFPWNIFPRSMTSIGGIVYWLMNYYIHDKTPKAIMCLDISTEVLTLVPVPFVNLTVERITVYSLLVEVQGKLCFLHITLNEDMTNLVHIWFMSDGPVSPTWTQYCHFSTNYNPRTILLPILLWNGSDDELILMRLHDDLYSYDRRSNEAWGVVHIRDLVDFYPEMNQIYRYHFFAVSAYTESLVTITPKQSDENLGAPLPVTTTPAPEPPDPPTPAPTPDQATSSRQPAPRRSTRAPRPVQRDSNFIWG